MSATEKTEPEAGSAVPGVSDAVAVDTALQIAAGTWFDEGRYYTDHEYHMRRGNCGYEKEPA